MGAKTGIEWTATRGAEGTVSPGSTWNPLRPWGSGEGVDRWYCEKVSPGCAHCYAGALNRRFGGMDYPAAGDPRTPEVRAGMEMAVDERVLLQPLRWRRPRRIFVCSMTDLFGEWVSDAMLDEIFGVMGLAQQHTFLVLTKRPERMRRWFSHPVRKYAAEVAAQHRVFSPPVFDWPLPNVWLGVSVENQHWAEIRIPRLLHTPAAVRFISAEPLLGPLDIENWLYRAWLIDLEHSKLLPSEPALDWVIAGGESGPRRREMDLAWARDISNQCVAAGVPFFFKQSSSARPGQGRIIDGRLWEEMPRAHGGER